MRLGIGTAALVFVASAVAGGLSSCSDRRTADACYFDDSDDAEAYGPVMPWRDWCDYGPDEVTPLIDEYCPASECIDTFITCDEVPLGDVCQTCPAEDLDHKVLVALGAEYEQRCPGESHDVIDFERGCMFETGPVPPKNQTKRCCYTAVVVGECSLMGT
jgi:hypothetical protein